MAQTVSIDSALCIGCATCVSDCPSKALAIKNGKAVYGGKCLECGHCVAICPTLAISMPSFDMAEVQDYNPISFDLSAENLLNSIKFRRSIRSFKPNKLYPDALQMMLQAGRYAPTAKNTQATRFIVVQDELDAFKKLFWAELPQIIAKLKENDSPTAAYERFLEMYNTAGRDGLFFNTPSIILIITENMWDGGLAAANIELMAVANGAGILHSGYLKRTISMSEALMKWLGIEGKSIACCLLAGYPERKYQRTAPRRKAEFTIR
ncbi:MAG: nitroreductase family protein [Clostridiaceae bacterium]|nr:nitroreductase family protein [Clostridiaceae bacterium]